MRLAKSGTALGRRVLFAVLVAAPVAAQERSFEIPAECGSEPAFRAELADLVGPDAERAEPSVLSISRASPDEEYRLTLVVGGEERVLTHVDCRVLFRSALVIAAASVRPAAEPEPTPPPPAPAPPPPKAVESPAATPPQSDAGPRVSGSLSGGAGFALGVLPEAAAVLEVRTAILVGLFGFSLSGKYMPSRSVTTEGRGADIHAFGLRPALFMTPIDELSVSAGLDADVLVGEGSSGIAAPGEGSAWTFAPSLELALIPINTKHLTLEVALQGRVAVQRPVFEVTGFRDLYQVPPLGMLGVVRGVWHFP